MNKKVLIFSFSFLFIFLTYIYGTISINKNKALLNYINDNNKTYIKVVSPSFDLEYHSSLVVLEKKLEKLIKFSNPDKEKQHFLYGPKEFFLVIVSTR